MAWQREYPGYLFDLDGTLIDTAPDLHRALNYTLRTHGHLAVSEALTRDCIGHGGRAMIRAALLSNDPAWQPEEHAVDLLLATFLNHYSAHIADFSTPYANVEFTLDRLRARGARLAVVTNKTSALAEQLLIRIGMRHLFDDVIGGDTAKRPKPAADPVLLALERLLLTQDDTLFVGDSDTDVGAARAAGVKVVCVGYGYSHGIAADNLGADGVIQSFLDLP